MGGLDFVVVTAHPDLLLYVDSLQRKNAESLAFYPKGVFEREAEKGRIFLGLLNGQPCGYLYAGAPAQDVKCHQACIQYDARRRAYGAGLVAHLEAYAESAHAHSVTLRCGFDLDANSFWREMGYSCVAVKDGGVRRMRRINVWRKWLLPTLIVQPSMEPEEGEVDASLWRRGKAAGVVTQFARGAAKEVYRAQVIARAKASLDDPS